MRALRGVANHRLDRVSFRGRIALWYAVAIPLLTFALVVTAQTVLVAALQSTLDETLQTRAETVASRILAGDGSGTDYAGIIDRLTEEELPSVPLLLRISNPDGRVLAAFGEIPGTIAGGIDQQLRAAPTTGAAFSTVRLRTDALQSYPLPIALRVYTAPVYDPSTGEVIAVIQTAESLRHVVAAQNRMWWYTAGIGVVGSVVTVVVGLLILRHGFQPLERILRRVHDVETTDLAAGLPDEPRPPELQELADSLNSMWRRLDSGFAEKQHFVGNVSHDLRTPLTVLRGQIDVLMMEPSLDPSLLPGLERMREEIGRLIRMADNLLVDTQLQASPRLSLVPMELRDLLEDVVLNMRVVSGGRSLHLSVPNEVMVNGDYDLLKQAVVNVVDNAIKYTPEGGRIDVRLGLDMGRGVIEVQDTGPGIPKDQIQLVTEPFFRGAAAPAGRVGGAGLGLSIVRRIVELHSGTVRIDSRPGAGTTVRLSIPAILAVTHQRAGAEGTATPG